ncbi:hypothetical protein LNP17_22955 [Klebsiella variicola subsp. variicola]|nr:hypothetical protein [Klebsiella variicola subsp. variicola]
MKKLITANDIRAAHARGEQAMSVVLRASIITPEAREVAELLGFTITEDDGAAPAATAANSDKTESQRIRETILVAVAGRPVYRKPGGAADGKGDEGEAVPGAGGDAARI